MDVQYTYLLPEIRMALEKEPLQLLRYGGLVCFKGRHLGSAQRTRGHLSRLNGF